MDGRLLILALKDERINTASAASDGRFLTHSLKKI